MKTINKLKRNVIDFFKTLRLYKYYKESVLVENIPDNTVIIMFDGRIIHGGLSDRLWGILSIFKYCKENNKKFKIYFSKPFKLQEFLIPNKVDWEITESQIVYNFKLSRPKYISMVSHDWSEMYRILKKKLSSNITQLHVYTNTRVISKREFGVYYNELFKMSPLLQDNYEKHRKKMNQRYVSCTFRFQQLLGDFKEGNFQTIIDENQKQKLIDDCILTVKRLQQKCNSEILVTSDSRTFLNFVKDLDKVYLVEGEVVHPDYDYDNSIEKYLKSFLDLYMIANAEEVYLCNVPPLYRSGFPETAACINDRPFYEITSFDELKIREWK